MQKIIKNICVILLLVLLLLSINSNIIYASSQITEASLVKIGDAEYHLKHYNSNKGVYTYVKVSIVGYYNEGKFYPAYCIDKTANGVGDIGSYYVDTNSVYNDNRVWRAIKNGYPYKSASEIGVSSDWNAYVVTKMAVYCILGQSNIDDFTADESDAEAVKMLVSLRNLVNIGLNGSEIYKDDAYIEKVGNLVEEANYYSQRYKVKSSLNLGGCEIKGINNAPEGTVVADKMGYIKTQFSRTEDFYVKIPKSQMKQNLDIEINVDIKMEDYKMFYGKARITGAQDCVVTQNKVNSINRTVNLKEKIDTGEIEINKIDEETKKAIPNVEFQIYNDKNALVNTGITNEKGILTVSELYYGNYKIRESKENEEYIKSDTEYEIQVKPNEKSKVEITNNHKKGNLKIKKLDKDNTNLALGNIEFDLYSEEFGKVIGTYFTDANGEMFIENLRTGNYKLIEKTTNKWYNLCGDTDIKINWNETYESKIYNELKKGQIKIIKTDKDNEEIRLSGVEFEILDNNNNILERIKTDNNGEALTSRYPIRDFQKINIRECKTLENYKLSEEIQTIDLVENETITVKFQNEKKKGQIKIIKKDADNQEIALQNVEFKIFDEENNLVDEIITNNEGEGISKLLPIDKQYIIKETKTLENYVLLEENKIVRLEEENVLDINFVNEKKKGQIKVIKKDADNHEIKLSNVEFKIYDENNNEEDTIITDEKGEALSKLLTIDKKYIIKESKTLDDYVLTEETKIVELKQNEVIEVGFTNEKKKGQVEIIKTSNKDNKITGEKAGAKLQGVKFEISDLNGKVIDELTTDENGKAISKKLERGKYKIKEISPKEGYLLDKKITEVNINENNEIKQVFLSNTPIDPNIEIKKYGPNEANVGEEIEYEIEIKNKGNVKLSEFKWTDTIDTNYIKLTKVKTGSYNKNTSYNVYYKTNLRNNENILFLEDLDSKKNYEIDFIKELADNEYITEITFEFKEAEIGLENKEKTKLYAKVLEKVKSEESFINEAKLIASYKDFKLEQVSKWKTIAYKVLPKTGL